jgi:signal transduction histidine kinase
VSRMESAGSSIGTNDEVRGVTGATKRRWVTARGGVVAVVLVGLDVTLFSRLTEDPANTAWVRAPVNALVIMLASAPAVPLLVLRRRAPVAAFALLTAHAVLLTLFVGTRPLLTLVVALYTVSAWRSTNVAVGCLAATLAVHSLAVAYEITAFGAAGAALDAFLIGTVLTLCDVAAWGFGRRAAAARSREHQLEASREAASSAAVAVERLRIARELHDIVAHSVTVMVLQAAGARKVMSSQPAHAGEAMQAVEEVGIRAMAELRRLLGVLRSVGYTEDVADATHAPRLSALQALAEQVRAAGVAVEIESHGTPVRLEHSVDLTAYRIVQEALTNTLKHAEATRADVVVRYAGSELVVEVVDDGRATAAAGDGGQGLIGMRERVALYGGELDAGRRDRGGFGVRARFPLDGEREPAR